MRHCLHQWHHWVDWADCLLWWLAIIGWKLHWSPGGASKCTRPCRTPPWTRSSGRHRKTLHNLWPRVSHTPSQLEAIAVYQSLSRHQRRQTEFSRWQIYPQWCTSSSISCPYWSEECHLCINANIGWNEVVETKYAEWAHGHMSISYKKDNNTARTITL